MKRKNRAAIGCAIMRLLKSCDRRRMKTDGLVLAFRHGDGKAVQTVRDLNLTGQSAVRLHLFGEIQHRLFHFLHGVEFGEERFVDIDMARGAGARTPAIGVDPWDHVLDRALHDGEAIFHVHNVFFAVVLDIFDFRHGWLGLQVAALR